MSWYYSEKNIFNRKVEFSGFWREWTSGGGNKNLVGESTGEAFPGGIDE